jgi:hypothetical protein
VGKTFDRINDILFWGLVAILVGGSVMTLVEYSRYGLLFDFRWNAIVFWLKGVIVGLGGCVWIGYKFGMYRGAKSKKCCLQYITEAQK